MFPLLALVAMAQQNQPNFNEVTIYNQGFGLVKEYRILNLKDGRQTVAIENVAAQIQPNTVSFQSITDKGSINVLEQNYQYDLISPEAILNKAVGQKIKFLRTLSTGVHEELSGTLMNAPTSVVNQGTEGSSSQTLYSGMVIKTNDGRIILNPEGEIEVESLPEGLISHPTLLWDLESTKAGENTVELRYVTSGMTWNADYVMTLDDVLGQSADLQGWVTLNNSSGATFKNTKLKLLAGDVNQVPRGAGGGFGGGGIMMQKAAAPAFQEQSLFEYHLYTLQRPTTLHEHETKQVSLLEGHNVKVTKRVIVDSMQDSGRYFPSEGEVGTGNISPQVRIEFVNSKENGLGIPLPQGTFKVYQKDSSGSVQLIGEDSIKHTPKDEKVSLVMGRSFDVVANRKRLEFHVLGPNHWTETFEITLRNHKAVSQDVVLLERHYGDWSVPKTSDPFTKTDSNSMQYVVNVPANGSKVVTYTVETKW